MKTFWTESEDALMREHYPNKNMAFMMDLLERSGCSIYNRANTLSIRKSQSYLDSPDACRLRCGDNIGAKFRFKKGQIPPNKGKRMEARGRSAETQFKKGAIPSNCRPVFSTRVVDGYQEIKVAEGMRQWKQLHRVIWARLNGQIPKGCNLIFLDGNRSNTSIANLSVMTKAENMKRNSHYNNYPKEISQIIQVRGALNRQINQRAKNEQHRNA